MGSTFEQLHFGETGLSSELDQIRYKLTSEPLAIYQDNDLLNQYLDLCRERDHLALSHEHYKNLFDYAPIAFFCFDEHGVFTDINNTGLELLDLEYKDVIGKLAILRISDASRQCFLSHLQIVKDGKCDTVEIEIERNNERVPILLKSIPIINEPGSHWCCQSAAVDISKRKAAEEELTRTKDNLVHLAHHDILTGLPNRLLFQDRLQQAILRTERSGRMGALAFLDLDHFKNINDSLGHQIGDEILRQVAKRLSQCIRHEDTVCRIGGDEFTIILENVLSPTHVVQIAGKLIETFHPPFYVYGNELHLKTSIGLSLFPKDSKNAQEIIKAADIAMYEAKSEGRNNFKLYQEKMRSRVDMRLNMENGLFKAIEEDRLILHYQPLFSSDLKQIRSLEALLRWRKTDSEMAYPGEFIPIAEETDLINDIGEWVIRSACLQINDWRRNGIIINRVSVNISPRQFTYRDFVPNVKKILAETNVSARHLEFELTESTIMADPASAVTLLDELMDMGISISIDDFGTGYSSLSQIKRFPIERLKIDASFVNSIPEDKNDCAIASAIISMAHELGLEVVSEGIETIEQIRFLKKNGCNLYQGNYLAVPMPAKQLQTGLIKGVHELGSS